MVNADDEVVGMVMREEHHANPETYTQRGEYWRGVACFLLNSMNQVWVPRRQPWRKVAPGGLDFSMAEHVQSGESRMEGALRGMEEELYLAVDPADLVLLGKKVFESFGCLMSVYIYRTDEDPDYSKDDYQSAEWLSIDELRARIEDGAPHKSGLPEWLDEIEEMI